MYLCMYLFYLCMYLCIYVCMYLFIYLFVCVFHSGVSPRSIYGHHHCVLDWLEDNGFGMSGSMNNHPDIFVYPYPNHTGYSSPNDGFVLEWGRNAPLREDECPLTVHPMKKHMYESPEDVAVFVRNFQKTDTPKGK